MNLKEHSRPRRKFGKTCGTSNPLKHSWMGLKKTKTTATKKK